MSTARQALVQAIRAQAAARPAWERAERCLLEVRLRQRLDEIGLAIDATAAAAMMAAAMVLAEEGPEWGGDYRDALSDLAEIALALTDE